LQRKGVIDLIPGASRGIQLKDILREQLGLPLIGRVAAGRPILAEEHIESRYQIRPEVIQPQPHYLLKVQGMSMKNAGILDGDLVAVHRTPEVRNRQIVVARLETKSPSSAIGRRHDRVLLPENSDFEPIRVDLKNSHDYRRVVVGVLRRVRRGCRVNAEAGSRSRPPVGAPAGRPRRGPGWSRQPASLAIFWPMHASGS